MPNMILPNMTWITLVACRLELLEGMGHDLPAVPEYLGRLLDLIEGHARSAK